MIEIDGSMGEGGGQVVRTALALSVVTGKGFTIRNIRAGRKKPGLKRQHVACVKAAQEICSARAIGGELQSDSLTFVPGKLKPGDYNFKIESAGSATLMAQTVLPALMCADAPSSISFEGGTHNPMAPPYDFLDRVYLPQVEKMGPKFERSIESYGFFPAGGGKFTIKITPREELRALEVFDLEDTPEVKVTALVANLPLDIAQREVDEVIRKGGWAANQGQAIEIENSPGPGNVVMIEMDRGYINEIVTGFGEKGVDAETVARKAYREAKKYIDSGLPVGEYLADQLLLPMGLAALHGEMSSFVCGPTSDHTETQIDVIKMFLDINIVAEETSLGRFEITVSAKIK